MASIQKALWYIESHSRMDIDLRQIARACHVSPYHLSRGFAEVFGISLIRYLRSRRLSEAAREIAAGAPDILSLALDYGYSSHEAFSRAFKREFERTPESVRAISDLAQLDLTEPFTMSTEQLPKLERPRVEYLDSTTIAGLVERYNCQSPAGIPDQWQRFAPHLGTIPTQVGDAAYGVCYNFDDGERFDYLSGVRVSSGSDVPPGLVCLTIPPQKFAVFPHRGHIAEIRSVMTAIWSGALSDAGYEAVDGPTLERYGPEFDSRTGQGGYEIWVAVK